MIPQRPRRNRPATRGRARRLASASIQAGAAAISDPAQIQIDCIPNPYPEMPYVARMALPLAVICPVTKKPDYAHFVIDYAPAELLVESGSVEALLASFHDQQFFNEACTLLIAKRLTEALRPRWLRVSGHFHWRGGVPIEIFY